MEVKKREGKKMVPDNSDHNDDSNLQLRAHLSVLKALLIEHLKFAYETAKASFTVVAMLLFIMHPLILLTYFVAINQLGNILLNYTLLGLFILDIAISAVGGLIMEGKREGIF